MLRNCSICVSSHILHFLHPQIVISIRLDIVVITGDLTDGLIGYDNATKMAVEPLKNIRSRLGKYFVTGRLFCKKN